MQPKYSCSDSYTPNVQFVPPPPAFSKSLLEHLYVGERLSLKSVAATLGISLGRTRRELVSNDIPIRTPKRAVRPHLSVEQLEAAKAEILVEQARLRQELLTAAAAEKAGLRQEISDLEEIWADTDRAYTQAVQERDEARAELQAQKDHCTHLQGVLAARRAEPSSDVQALLREVVAGLKNPEQCLRIVAAAYPERIVLLDSAIRSAKDADDFRRVGGLAELLKKWATNYYDALVEGAGDEGGGNRVGWRCYPNRGGGPGRVFEYKGRKISVGRHLRIGTNESLGETIRVYFAWDASSKKLIVGWCGRHQ